MAIVRLGSRGSHLALVQSRYIRKCISDLPGNPETDLIIIKTTGDKNLGVDLALLGDTPDDRKGLFTKELEDALLDKRIDLAVHSFKDMPTADVSGLVIASIPQRVSPRDVLIFPEEKRVSREPPFIALDSRVGTSSVRRVAQLGFLWPQMRCLPLRGNLPTRLGRLMRGETRDLNAEDKGMEPIDAIMLAEAGLLRLKAQGFFESAEHARLLSGMTIEPLPEELFVPAPAQGALAIQCRSDDQETIAYLKALHSDAEAEYVEAERLILAKLEGGCHLPLGAHCHKNEHTVEMQIFLGSEAVNNRKQKSYAFHRFGKSTTELTLRVLAEITRPLPVVLTGKQKRIEQLQTSFGDRELIALPLIETEEIAPHANIAKRFRDWLTALKSPTTTAVNSPHATAPLIAAFSVPGVMALRNYLEKEKLQLSADELERIHWAVTGDKTAAAVSEAFPGSKVAYRSSDGTGLGLAELLLESKVAINTGEICALSAEMGRPEFYDLMEAAGMKIIRMALYRTRGRELPAAEAAGLPAEAYILFGSPSAVNAFFSAAPASANGHRYCALGPTTAAAIREQGGDVYAIAAKPDYEAFIEEFL